MAVYFYESWSIWQAFTQAFRAIPNTSGLVKIYSHTACLCLISYLLSNCFDSEFCKHIWTKRKLTRSVVWYTCCVTSVVEYFDWLKNKPNYQVPSTECTMIHSKAVVSFGCHSFPNLLKSKFVLYNITIYLYCFFGHCYVLFWCYYLRASWI